MAIYIELLALIVIGAIIYYLIAPTVDSTSSTIPLLTVFSLGYDVLLVGLVGWRILSPGSSIYDTLCFCSFLFPLLGLVVVSAYSFAKGKAQQRKSPSLLINLTTLSLCIVLAIISSVWDVGFAWHYKDYVAATHTLDFGTVKPAKGQGRTIKLPAEYTHLTVGGEAFFLLGGKTDGQMVAFPESPPDLDHLFGAYVFAPKTEPSNVPGQCISGYPVRPYHEHWYYCVLSLGQIYGWSTR
jgi:hypothetical protein